MLTQVNPSKLDAVQNCTSVESFGSYHSIFIYHTLNTELPRNLLFSVQAKRNKREQSPDVAANNTDAADEEKRFPECDEDEGTDTETDVPAVAGPDREGGEILFSPTSIPLLCFRFSLKFSYCIYVHILQVLISAFILLLILSSY